MYILRNKTDIATAMLAVAACGIAAYAVVTYVIGAAAQSGFMQGKVHYQGFVLTTGWSQALLAHVLGGSLALLAGAAQWLLVSTTVRKQAGLRRLHIGLGLVYLLSILVSAVAGGVMATQAMGRWIASLGFAALDVLWVLSTTRAAWLGNLLRANPADQQARRLHRRWMMRSYALTAAAITLRIWLPLSMVLGLDFITAYQAIAWLCWVPNLFLAEYLAR